MTTLSPDRLRLKRLTRALIAANGGLEGAAATVGKSTSQLSRAQHPNDPTFLTIDDVCALEETASRTDGWPPVTREAARRAGFALVALPLVDGEGVELPGLFAAQCAEAANVTAALAPLVVEGRARPDEARAARAALADLVARAMATDAVLARIEEGA